MYMSLFRSSNGIQISSITVYNDSGEFLKQLFDEFLKEKISLLGKIANKELNVSSYTNRKLDYKTWIKTSYKSFYKFDENNKNPKNIHKSTISKMFIKYYEDNIEEYYKGGEK